MVKLARILTTCIVPLWFFIAVHTKASPTQFPELYFSEIDDSGVPQMRVLRANGEVEDVFSINNDGYVEGLSPDGTHLAFVRYQWDIPSSESQSRIWLANLQTGRQWPAGGWSKISGGLWSPNSQYFLIHQIEAVVPLWAGYNYGQLSVYSLVDGSVIQLEDVLGFAEGWYPNSQELLLWNESEGYFTYSLATESEHQIQFQPTVTGPFRWSDISPSRENIIAIPAMENQLLIYSLNSGNLLERITMESGDFVSRPYWSPDSRFLAIELSSNNLLIWDYQSNEILSQVTNPVNGPSIGFSYEVYWTVSPQQLFIIVRLNSGNAIYEVDLFSGDTMLVYQAN